ncbi:MAG: helix-turn-helix domain-containing protein [Nitrosopumilaceae archaeon]|nr:helix-turn-helix domain-containing protein [Nitrosopumilaceae archaeon]
MGTSEDETFRELLESLQFFGLEHLESEIYLLLLENGPATMSDLAAKLDVDRGRIYRAMDKLSELNIIKINDSKVRTCNAIPPEKALSALINKKKEQVANLKKISKLISKELEVITRPIKEPESPTFSLIEGRNSIYSRIGKLIQESENPVYLVTTTDDFIRMFQTAIPEKISIATKNGVELRILVDADEPILQDITSTEGFPEIRIGKLPSKSRIIVEKQTQILMSGNIKPSTSLHENSESILHSSSQEMAENMFSLCDQLWKKTKHVVVSSSKN